MLFVTLNQLKQAIIKTTSALVEKINKIKKNIDNRLSNHISDKENPHNVTLSQLGVTSSPEHLNNTAMVQFIFWEEND